jgi:two-component system LytT family response regulator
MNEERLSAVLVDDEEHCTETLQWMLGEYCPRVDVRSVFNDPVEALRGLSTQQVDIIFLDIEMPVMNAFGLLRALGTDRGAVIFTTAYDEFAIQAIKHDALDYLMKPVDKEELLAAVARASDMDRRQEMMQRIDGLLDRVAQGSVRERIAIPTLDGLEMLALDQVVHARASDNYTELHLVDGSRIVVSRTLKDVEQDLPARRFVRIHLSHMVALDHIVRYVRGVGGYVVLDNGMQLPVSRSRKDELLARLGGR